MCRRNNSNIEKEIVKDR